MAGDQADQGAVGILTGQPEAAVGTLRRHRREGAIAAPDIENGPEDQSRDQAVQSVAKDEPGDPRPLLDAEMGFIEDHPPAGSRHPAQ